MTRQLSEKEFEEEFNPLPKNKDGDLMREHEEVVDLPLNTVWTVVDDGGETDNWYAIPGFHIVNKIGYVVTEKPWEDDDIEAMYFEGRKPLDIEPEVEWYDSDSIAFQIDGNDLVHVSEIDDEGNATIRVFASTEREATVLFEGTVNVFKHREKEDEEL